LHHNAVTAAMLSSAHSGELKAAGSSANGARFIYPLLNLPLERHNAAGGGRAKWRCGVVPNAEASAVGH